MTNKGDVDELNLEVLSSTARAITDEDAFDDMVASWDKRLSVPAEQEKPGNLNKLLSNLQEMMQLFATKAQSVLQDDVAELVKRENVSSVILTQDLKPLYWNDYWTEFKLKLCDGNFTSDQIAHEDILQLQAAVGTDGATDNLQANLVRIFDRDDQQHFFLASPVSSKQGQPLYHLRRLTIGWTEQLGELIVEAYGLSDAECEIARLILDGCKAEVIAGRRNATVGTVRKQIQSLLKKCAVGSQVELVQTLSLVSTNLAKPKGSMTFDWADPWKAERRIIRPGGHVLAYSETGKIGGLPVLIIHGEGIGYALPNLPELAVERGWHIYAIQRPGHGNSAIGDDENGFDAGCAAIAHICKAVIGNPAAIIAMHAGTRIALKLIHDGLVKPQRLVALNSLLPLESPFVERLPPFQRAWFKLVKMSPDLAALATQASWNFIQKNGLIWYLERHFSGSAEDIAIIKDPIHYMLLENATAMMLRQGPRALVEDVRIYTIETDAWIRSLDIPVDLFIGEQNPRHYPEDATYYMTLFPNLNLHIMPETAELVAYAKTDEILERIKLH